MVRELEPCPFCPDGGKPARKFMTYFKSNGYWVECEVCNSTSGQRKSREEADEAWNSRYKRTCKLIMHDGSPACSECLAEQDYDARFCDQCGAEVADGD